MITDIKILHNFFLKCKGASIDSRTTAFGDMFFSLKGKNNNGNEFAKQALHNGAAYSVIDDVKFKLDERYLLVENGLESLQNLAKYHRSLFNIPVIAVTGSSGKTTTKNLVARALSFGKYNVCATEGNLNSLVAGVPLTLLRMTEETEIAVIEMGVSRIGELHAICGIAMPTHGVITHVKSVHIEGFKNFEGVVQGKTELYRYLSQHPDGIVFVNCTENILLKTAKNLFDEKNIKCYQNPDQEDYCEIIEEDPFLVYKTKSNDRVETNLLGKFHINNISTAICIAKYFGVKEAVIHEAIKSYKPKNNRSEIIEKSTNLFLLDAYNANLESMQGVIQSFANIKNEKKIVILGAMREMGDQTEYIHTALGKFLLPYKEIFTIILCGESMQWAKNICHSALLFKTKEELEIYLKNKKFTDTSFLLKGSRFWELETLLDLID